MISIRKATKKDINSLSFLIQKFDEFNSKHRKFAKKCTKKEFNNFAESMLTKKNSIVLVALLENQPIGYANFIKVKQLNSLFLEDLFILKEFRGKRIGKKILDEIKKYALANKMNIKGEVFTWNKKAINFYKKNGFKTDSIAITYEL